MAKLTYTGAEVQSLLDKVNGISGGGGGIAYPLSWSGYSSGVYDGSAPADIAIPSLLSQLTNDVEFITTASVNSLLTDYLPKSGGVVSGNITAPTFVGKLSSIGLLSDSIDRGTIAYSRFDNPENIYGLPNNDNANGVLSINTHAGYYHHQLGFSTSGFFYRKVYDRGINTSGDWKQVAFTDSNVASATKLQTPRTIWGQSFDGTGNILGDLTNVGNIYSRGAQNGGYAIYSSIRWDEALSIETTDNNGNWLAIGIIVKTNGNVAIGGATAAEKLHVHGNILATGEVTQHSSLVLKDVVDTRFLTLKELVALKPYSFRWKDKRDDKLHAGAVADYVMPILPEVISTDKDNIHSMNYANAAWVVGTSLTPYVCKHEEDIEWLKSRVKYLEGKLKES